MAKKKSLVRRNKATTNEARHTPMLRQLQTDQCAVNNALNTTYNPNKDVVPFVGIMFSVFAKTPLDILTMELDIRFGDNTDLSVEVYTYKGRYDLIFNDPIFWTLIANTTAVPAPEGTGAIIPVSDFDNVSIGQNERRSFYITMKAPILQYNVDALVKTDEVALQTTDIELLAGVGFSEYKFPEAINTLVDPQFTGVLHYAYKSTCGQVSSTVYYEFILNEKLLVGVLEEFTRQVDAAVTDLMQNNSRLQVLQETHDLQKDGDAQTATAIYTGNCPNEVCSSLLRTSVSFIHDDSLRSGQLIYSLYQFADVITKAVGQHMSGVEVLYVGPRDVAATFGIVLGGVPQGETMDAVQQEYFADVTVDFLSGKSGGDRVLDLQIEEQIDNDGSIQVLGKLLGASYQPVASFVNGLESSFREGQETYVQRLIFDRLRPNAINENGGIEFFEGISSVGGTVDVDPDAAARPQVDDGGSSSTLLIIAIVSAVGGIALILLACWYCLSRLKSTEEMRELKRYRERMKVERRARRQDGKETLLGQGDDPEDTHNYRGGITSASDEGSDGQNVPSSEDDGRQSTVATAIVADDAEFTDFPEDRNDKGQRQIPGDSPPLTHREKPPLRSVKKHGDDLSSSSERRDKPKPAKPDTDNAEDSQKPNAAFDTRTSPTPRGASPADSNGFPSQAPFVPAPAKPKGASPTALSRFIKAEPKTSADKLSGSRSVQYQRPAALGPTSKKVKEAEDVPSGSPRKRPPVRGNTKSLDESAFKGELGQNAQAPSLGKINEGSDTPGTASGAPTSAKLQGASPNQLSQYMKEQPKLPTRKLSGSRSVQYQPPAALDGTSGISPKKPQLRSSKTEDDLPKSPRKRVAPKPTKSMDTNEFPRQAPVVPAPAKPMGASPAALSRFMKAEPKTSTNKLGGSRSVQLPPVLSPTSKKYKEAEDVRHGSPRRRPPVRGNTKSLDESGLKGELYPKTQVRPLRKNSEGSAAPATASGSPASMKTKDAAPKPPTRNYQPPGALGSPSKKVTEAEDVPTGSPRKRLPVRGASHSRDDPLSPLAIPSKYKVDHGKDRPGDVSMKPTVVEKSGLGEPRSSLAIPSKYKVDHGKDTPPAGVVSTKPTMVETGLQHASPVSSLKPTVRP